MKLEEIAKRFRIDDAAKFSLSKHDPAETCGLSIDKADAKVMLEDGVKRLEELQEKLYASDRWSVLIVMQGMDAAGKDSLIKHVMSGVNPQGVEVNAFKQPSDEELQHDFLWRVAKKLPARGRIGIFNRSHYEDVLVARVHPEVIARAKLPEELADKHLWRHRYDDICAFERHLARNGTLILKFFLNVSHKEQRQRFLDRVDLPAKRWKFSMNDVNERKLWPQYMNVYEEAIRETSIAEAPWYVLPADNKWFTRLVAAAAIVEALDRLKLDYPKLTGEALKALEQAGKALKAEKG
jgi:PPK2 family polyphosphate:nucleotide phosphotransferase